MSAAAVAWILFISLIVFLMLNVPVGFAIGLSAFVAILAGGTQSVGYLSQTMVAGCDSFPILAVPLFILAGELMGNGGVSKRILNVCNAFFGRFYGGLAICTVVFCMFFAAVSGSGPATVAAVGGMVVPTMLKNGYSKPFTLALIACAGGIGVIIPPSIPMVFYGTTTGASIGELFMAGFMPGILIGLCLIAFCYFYSRKQGWKDSNAKFSWRVAGRALWDGKYALLNPVIILGGIYAGIFTPTEAAAVACFYALFCGFVVHREMTVKSFVATMKSAVSTIGTTMLIVGCATSFAKVLSITGAPTAIANAIGNFSDSWLVVIMLINVLLLFVGCFMDTTAALIILVPILYPVVTAVGVNPIHFAMIICVNLAVGQITPPFGCNLFVACGTAKIGLEAISKKIVPFIVALIACVLLVTYIEPISLILPKMLGASV